jgi:hypothetical protein
MFVLAPLFTLIAMVVGGVATIFATILNGPRRLLRRGEAPLVVMPPVPTPEMLAWEIEIAELESEREPVLVR